jgi:methyl-accepting chemotaxis protein
MSLWRNAKIRTKVGIGLLVALMGLAGFAATLVAGKQAEASASAQVEMLASLSVKTGDLLHETQRERGRTSQYASSKGAKWGSELRTQRQVTDQRIAELLAAVTADGDKLPVVVRASFGEATTAVGKVSALRMLADGLQTSPAQIIRGYTEINKVLLSTIAVAAAENRNPGIAARLQAYLAQLSAKESAGLERAQLANVFTVDRFADGQFSLVVSLIATQQAYLTVFERSATADVLQKWSHLQTSEVFTRVAELEKIAIVKAGTGGFGVDPASWFETMSKKIDLYKEHEDYQAKQILADAKADQQAALAAARTALAIVVGLVLLTVAIAVCVILSITRPLRQVSEVAEQMAVGDVSQDITYRSGDELGHLANSFRKLAEYMRESADLATTVAQGDLTRTVRPRGERDLLGNALQQTVIRLSGMVAEIQRSGLRLASSASQLTSASSVLIDNAEETTAKATSVSAASEEMTASITEISRSTTEAAAVARDAVAAAEETGRVITALSEASGEIGGVVELIQAIASQTNLLALNATIEAARAGDAGKGFAVVAEEVKRLAQQTAEATTTITNRVQSIEDGASAAALAITQIGDVVGRINEITTTIASAIEEQTVTTSEISRSVAAVAGAANATTRVTGESAESAQKLASMATTLHDLVDQFTVDSEESADRTLMPSTV